MSNKQKFLAGMAILVLPVILAGCGKTVGEKLAENAIENQMGGNVKVDSDAQSVEITTDQGTLKAGGEIALPDNFPSDIYVIDGKIMSAMDSAQAQTHSLSIQSEKSVKEASDIYKAKIEETGWKIDTSMNAGTTSVIGASKGERALSVVIGNNEDGAGSLVTIVDSVQK